MNHRGVEYIVAMTAVPNVWKWQFRIGDEVRTGKTEARLSLLAMRRVRMRIDRELKHLERQSADRLPATDGVASVLWPLRLQPGTV